MTNKDFLKAKDGLIIGLDEKNNFYRVDGYQHILLMAPTGAGKGVGFVIPNLLSSTDSVIIHDIKMENFELTSGWRAKQGQKIYKFEPLNKEGKTHCFNPLDFVSKEPDLMFDDLQKMANIFLPSNGDCRAKERNLFVATCLYLLASSKKLKTFGEIYRILNGDLAKELKSALKLKIHKNGLMLISNFLSREKDLLPMVASSLSSHMELWGNPLIDHATSKSDFNPANFKRELTTLYVGLEPTDMIRLKPLMQFFYQYIAAVLSKPCDQKKDTHGVLLILDDFPSIGKMDILTSCIPYFRGYKVRLLLIAQDLNDLRNGYCDKGVNSLLSNSSFKVAFATNDIDTANFISLISVDREEKDLQFSLEDIMSLSQDKQIIISDNHQPIITKKLHYYDFPELEKRVIEPTKLKF